MLAGGAVAGRDRRVDLLRGISIVLVLLHHFSLAYSLRDSWPSRLFGWAAVHAVTRNGNYGVTIFFVVSGYLITSNTQARWGALRLVGLRDFYVRRAARILPCLILLLATVNLLAAAGFGIFGNHPESAAPVPFWVVDAACLTFWMNVLIARAGWLNYVLCVVWSLSVEEVFYLGFPVLCVVLPRTRWLLAAWAVFIVAGPAWRLAFPDDEAQFLYSYLACFDGIAIGCCAAVLAPSVVLRGAWVTAATAAVVVGMVGFYLGWSIGVTNGFGVTLMALGAAFLILAGRDNAGASGGRIGSAVRWCGGLSYELYLFHLVVLAGLRCVWAPEVTAGDGALVLLAGYLVLSAGLAWGVARFYAEPVNRWVRRAALARVRQEDWGPRPLPWPLG